MSAARRPGRRPLRRPARRLPDQDGPRSHPGRRADALHLKSGIGDISVERATGHAEVTTGSGEVRAARARRQRGDQELQRRHVGRPRRRRRAAERGQRRHRRRAGRAPASSPSPRTATSGWARSCAARSSSRPSVGDLEVGIREGSAAWLDVRPPSAGCTTRSRPPRRPGRRPRPSRCAPARPSATSSSGAPRARLSCRRSTPRAPRDSARSAPR